MGEHLTLAFGGAAAVAAHDRNDERLHSAVPPRVDHGLDDRAYIGDSPAANADGHTAAGRNRLDPPGTVHFFANGGIYVRQ